MKSSVKLGISGGTKLDYRFKPCYREYDPDDCRYKPCKFRHEFTDEELFHGLEYASKPNCKRLCLDELYVSGSCSKGQQCTFVHEPVALNRAKVAHGRILPCRRELLKKGTCTLSEEKCQFSHAQDNINRFKQICRSGNWKSKVPEYSLSRMEPD